MSMPIPGLQRFDHDVNVIALGLKESYINAKCIIHKMDGL